MSRSRRAFALPIVLALTLATSLAISVMLQRQAASRLTTVRELESYRLHHASRGLRELIDAWQKTVSPEALAEVTLTGEAQVLEADIEGGGRLVAYVSAVQGKLPTTPARPEAASTLREAERLLRLDVEDTRPLVRAVGPAEVDVLTAPQSVLRALAEAVTEDTRASDRFAREVERRRGKGSQLVEKVGENGWLLEAMSRAEIEEPLQESLESFLTTEPELFRTRVDLYADKLDREPTLRYEGLFMTGTLRDLEWQSLREGQNFLYWGPLEPELEDTDPSARPGRG
ncbi:MAG: hypothetical protein AAGG07_09525 [Planctomycetota bacterium]